MTLTVILDPAIHPPRHIDVTYIWVLIMSLRRNLLLIVTVLIRECDFNAKFDTCNAGTTRLS